MKKTFEVGKKLQQIRKEKGLTQKEVGQKLGYTNRVISYYENECADDSFRSEMLDKLESFYDVDLRENITLDNNKIHKIDLNYNLKNLEELEEIGHEIKNIRNGLANNLTEIELNVTIKINELIVNNKE